MGLFDKMTEPEFIKEDCSAEDQLRQLTQLLEGPVPKNIREKLEEEIRNIRAGMEGENRIAFELRNSHLPMFVLRDLCLADGDLTAQMDFLVITRKLRFIIECKNLYGNIKIDSKGSFIRTTFWNGKYRKEGIYSPVTQNERHLELLKSVRSKEKSGLVRQLYLSNFEKVHKSIVVLANPKTLLDDSEADEAVRAQVIRADQLISYIKGQVSASKAGASSDKEMRAFAEALLRHHTPVQRDYTQMFLDRVSSRHHTAPVRPVPKAVEKVVPTPPAEAAPADGKDAPVCTRCGSAMVKRVAKKGDNKGKEFYGCSAYPKCRNIIKID